MTRHPIALAFPSPYPPLPTSPHPSPSPLQTLISTTLHSSDYDAVCIPLTNGKWQERWEQLCLRPAEDEDAEPDIQAARDLEREKIDRQADVWRKEGGLRREEVNVCRLEETQSLVGIAAEWLELDSPDEGIRFDSELALRAELAQAIYLSLPSIIIPAPNLANRAYLPSYARAISNLLQLGSASAFTQLSIRIPVSDPIELIGQGPHANGNDMPEASSSSTGDRHKRVSSISTRPVSMHQSIPVTPQNMRVPSGASAASSMMSAGSAVTGGSTDPSSTWEMWDCIRTMCGYHPRLSVTLDLTNPLPPSVGALARWTAEPVKNIWLPASSFIPNAKGYPVLSKACQAFLRGMGKHNPTYILAQTTLTRHPSGGPSAYLQYVRHITSQPQSSNANPEYTTGYADYLQAPLQPLMDDLGSATYDVFERDLVKYRQYEEAIFLALFDLPASRPYVITVVGAGRGPLVSCALRALTRAERRAKIYAIEKNAPAIVTLEERKALEWHDSVDVIHGDMRTIAIPELADILVSELLGSFGDNELSPECLDGAMRFLRPEGISIPISYTAHLAPLSSSKLHADVIAPARPAGAAETPYVVMMQAVNIVSGDGGGVAGRCGEKIQQCWQFEHPRRDLIMDSLGAPLTNSHNTRSSTLTFHIPHAAPLHGFVGYFESHLYGNIGLSIHPDNAHRVSPDMFSWFPLFFPLKEPLYLPSGSELEVNIWRLWDGGRQRVWYEWSAEVYLPLSGNGVGAGIGLERRTSANGLTPPIGRGVSQVGGAPSPMMDAPFSPGLSSTSGAGASGANGAGLGSSGQGGDMRIKIGQTSLHNPGGIHSWVGL